jgi:arabinofuranosyltransferase
LAAVPAALLGVAGWQHRWMSDDAFIHLRVVEQLTAGHGPVYNLHERVEASTSALWVGILALADLVGGWALPWKAVVLGLVFAGGGLLLAERAGTRLARADGDLRPVVPLGAFVVAALPPFWDYATSGLETGLTFGWLGACQWWCARRVTAAEPMGWGADLLGGVLVGLGYLVRPDLAVFTLAFAVVLVLAVRRAGPWRVAALVAAMGALPLAYQVFRMGYYGMLVPNTAVAKEAGHAQWGQGWEYLADLSAPYWLWWPVAGLGALLVAQAVADRRAGARLRAACRLAPAVAAVVYGLYVVRVGGDFMHARLLLPALFALAAPVGVPVSAADLQRLRGPWEPRLVVLALVGAWAVVCAALLPFAGAIPHTPGFSIEDERAHWDGRVRLDLLASQFGGPRRGEIRALEASAVKLAVVDVPLRRGAPVPAAMVPTEGDGRAYAWDLDVDVLEYGSLAHPVGGHLDELVGSRPGHQKPLMPVWQLAGLVDHRTVYADDGTVWVRGRDIRAADRAMHCGGLADYLAGIHGRLSLGRFLSNVGHSLTNTRLRVPVDPEEAERQFCGGSADRHTAAPPPSPARSGTNHTQGRASPTAR